MSYSPGVPAVSAYDLKVHPTDRFLAAGTPCRSMWRLDLGNVTTADDVERRARRVTLTR